MYKTNNTKYVHSDFFFFCKMSTTYSELGLLRCSGSFDAFTVHQSPVRSSIIPFMYLSVYLSTHAYFYMSVRMSVLVAIVWFAN